MKDLVNVEFIIYFFKPINEIIFSLIFQVFFSTIFFVYCVDVHKSLHQLALFVVWS